MPTYRQAEREDQELLSDVMAEYHPRLCDAGVSVGLLHAHAPRDDATGLPKGPALKLHGDVALAIIKINALRCRVEGKPDATIVLDGDSWPEHSLAKKRALLDHELTHLLLVHEEGDSGPIKLDDANRPKLKMRPHDLVLGAFLEVVDRHGKTACESESYTQIHKEFSQRCFPWG